MNGMFEGCGEHFHNGADLQTSDRRKHYNEHKQRCDLTGTIANGKYDGVVVHLPAMRKKSKLEQSSK